MNIRRAMSTDVPALARLSRPVQGMHAADHPERFRRNAPLKLVESAFGTIIQEPTSFWLLAEEDRPIGFLSAEFRNREENWCFVAHRSCYLAEIVVESAFRKRGVARALIAELQREVDARGAIGIDLDAWRFNKQAIRAFRRLGFRCIFERMTRVQAKAP